MIPAGIFSVSDAERARMSSARTLSEGGGAGAVANLIGMLTDPSWVVRRAVVEALALAGDSASLSLCEVLAKDRTSEAKLAATVDALVALRGNPEPAVFALLENPDTAVIADAIQVLGRRRAASAVPTLIRMTKHEDDVVSVAALEALGRIGGRAAVEALIETVGGGSFFRTFPAIDILGRSGDPRVIEPLAKLLENPNYLPEAARALGRTGERGALRPLVNLLRSSSDSVIRVAAVALWELRERFEEKSGGDALVIEELLRTEVDAVMVRRLGRAMGSLDLPEALAICRLFGAIRSEEAAPLLAATLDGPPAVAECAAQSMKRIGKESDSLLLRAIRDGDSGRRKILLPVVTRSAAATDVAKCLDDADSEVRAMACEALARLGNVDVVAKVFNLLRDPNIRVVHAAIAAIQALGSREGRELAVAASRSENSAVRRAALRILSYFGDASSLQPILDGLKDEDPRVREVAIQGLPYLEDPRAHTALFEMAKNGDDRIRSLSMRALGQLPKADERAYSVLLKGLRDADSWVRYYACQSLGRLVYEPAAVEIAGLLQDSAGQVRVSAVEALSHLESHAAHLALKQAAASDEADVKRAAIVGLGMMHRQEDLPLILEAATSSDVSTRLIALSALVNFLSPRVVGALSSAAADADEQVRSAAIGFLASRTEHEATEVLVELLARPELAERAKAALLVPNIGRVPGILQALESADDELASVLVSLLARLQRADAKPALFEAMKLKNVAARKAAATSIAASRIPEKNAVLKDAAANDPDAGVRQISALLLIE